MTMTTTGTVLDAFGRPVIARAATAASDVNVLPGPWRPAPTSSTPVYPPAHPGAVPMMPVGGGGGDGGGGGGGGGAVPLWGPLAAGIPRGAQPGAQFAQPSMVTAMVAPVEAPEIEAFPEQGFYPSVLALAPSGMGKSEACASLCDIGMRVLVVLCEPKGAAYARRRPDIVMIAQPGSTYVHRYDRVMRFVDELASGRYHKSPSGHAYDAIVVDGLSEIGDMIAAKFAGMDRSGKGTFDFYNTLGARAVHVFHALRDAAGIASAKASVPPIPVVTTCIEALQTIGSDATMQQRVEWQPLLGQGKIAGKNLARNFETIFRLETGWNEKNEFEFRVWTQATPGREGKSPMIFNVCERGPGSYVDPGTRRVVGWPHVGVMFARLLSDPRSSFYREDVAKRFAGLWAR